MFELIYNLPDELRDAWRIAEAQHLPRIRLPQSIAVGGMGGSGIGGDILQALLAPRSPIRILTVKDYELPAAVNKETLFFAVSYSGNTEETLSCYQQARERKASVVVIASGGELADQARRHREPVITIPTGYPPRAAIGYLFTTLAVTLCRFRVIPDLRPELRETIRLLTQSRNRLRIRARNLAKELNERVPIIYSTSRLLDPVANRWRCQFNENAKVFAHVNSFPELDHNEIVGMGSPRAFARLCYLLVLSDPDAHERNNLRYELTLDLLKKEYAEARVIAAEGKSPLAHVFSLILLGDMLSYYLAVERRVDPSRVRRIEELKKRLAGVE
jgi:glucose/mannose-6-phosphate isomerase